MGLGAHGGLRAEVRSQSSWESPVSPLRRRGGHGGPGSGVGGPAHTPPIFRHVAWEQGPLSGPVFRTGLALPEAVLRARATDSRQE